MVWVLDEVFLLYHPVLLPVLILLFLTDNCLPVCYFTYSNYPTYSNTYCLPV